MVTGRPVRDGGAWPHAREARDRARRARCPSRSTATSRRTDGTDGARHADAGRSPLGPVLAARRSPRPAPHSPQRFGRRTPCRRHDRTRPGVIARLRAERARPAMPGPIIDVRRQQPCRHVRGGNQELDHRAGGGRVAAHGRRPSDHGWAVRTVHSPRVSHVAKTRPADGTAKPHGWDVRIVLPDGTDVPGASSTSRLRPPAAGCRPTQRAACGNPTQPMPDRLSTPSSRTPLAQTRS